MKKLLLMTGVLLALTAAVASAQVNLAWNNCIASGTSAVDKSWACDDNFAAAFRLVPSFISPANLTAFVGAQLVVDIQSAAPTIPDWWGLCRSDQITVAAPGGLSALCVNPFAGGNTGGGVDLAPGFGGANRARLRTALSRDTPFNIANGAHTYASLVQIALAKTVEVDPGDPVCAGCALDACLVLNSVELLQVAGTPPQDIYVLSNVATRNHVTYQGGTIDQPGCPGATPTKNATWGSVKSLYR